MLKHLRSLVVAYDHLSDGMRRDLTTALEIIKNRVVLNMVRDGEIARVARRLLSVLCCIVDEFG